LKLDRINKINRILGLVEIGIILSLCSCSHLTIAPPAVQVRQSSSWAQQNIIDADGRGVLVTAEWVRVYRELLKNYGKNLPVSERPASPDDGIKPEGLRAGVAVFRVEYPVNDRFADLKYFERNSGL
jgi:hypothetical protein